MDGLEVWCNFLPGPVFFPGREGMMSSPVWFHVHSREYGIPYFPVLTSSGGHQSGQNISYWNAFLLQLVLIFTINKGDRKIR